MRFAVAVVPGLTALLVTIFLHGLAPEPTHWPARIITWALLLGVSTITALVVERQLREVLPLALLLRMTLVFPDAAPSRYAVARAASSPAKIKQLAAAGSTPRAAAAAQVLGLVAALAKHDRYTRGHSERVRVFTDLIAEQMGVPGPDRDKLAWGALLHDIGKMTVPGSLLNKAGKPTAQEWEVLKGHPLAGAGFAGPLMEWLGPWAGGITQHHERFDGKGYPHGIAGHDITTAGRIVAVADSYETMTAARSYKKPMSVSAARKELTDCAGAHFDPAVVRAFLEVSLPKLMWGVGPASFLLHLPLMARAQMLGLQLAANATTVAGPAVAATIGAASVVTTGVAVAAPTVPSTPATTVSQVQQSQTPAGTPAGPAVPRPSRVADVSRSHGTSSTTVVPSTPAQPSRAPSGPAATQVPPTTSGTPAAGVAAAGPSTGAGNSAATATPSKTNSSGGNGDGNGNGNGNDNSSSSSSGSDGNGSSSGKGKGKKSSSDGATSTPTATPTSKGKGKN